MASNAEAISRLLANSTLLRGERELLRKQDQLPAEPPKLSSQPAAPPISHDARAIASVLLILLDERLASDAEAAGRSETQAGPSRVAANDSGTAPKGIAAMYVEDGLKTSGETTRPDVVFDAEPSRPREFTAGNPSELQSFIQRLAAIAIGRSDEYQKGWAGSRKGGQSAPISTMSGIKIAAVTIAILCVAVLIAGSIPN